jgi:hypothetical protein
VNFWVYCFLVPGIQNSAWFFQIRPDILREGSGFAFGDEAGIFRCPRSIPQGVCLYPEQKMQKDRPAAAGSHLDFGFSIVHSLVILFDGAS